MLRIRSAETDADLARCFPVLRELRPSLSPDTFLATMRRMKAGGYFLVMGEHKGEVVAVAGYRFSEHLLRGPYLYVDDLVTLRSGQRQGHGARLLTWLTRQAKKAGCREVHLDTGLERLHAHLFYEKVGLKFTSRHYALKLT